MQAIQTKKVGPTGSHGARIRAKCDAGSITVARDFELDDEQNHVAAAKQLAAKLGWTEDKGYGPLACGGLNGTTYVHVFVEPKKGAK